MLQQIVFGNYSQYYSIPGNGNDRQVISAHPAKNKLGIHIDRRLKRAAVPMCADGRLAPEALVPK
jgi:hypothetical protein